MGRRAAAIAAEEHERRGAITRRVAAAIGESRGYRSSEEGAVAGEGLEAGACLPLGAPALERVIGAADREDLEPVAAGVVSSDHHDPQTEAVRVALQPNAERRFGCHDGLLTPAQSDGRFVVRPGC